jgi:hypothetical protein
MEYLKSLKMPDVTKGTWQLMFEDPSSQVALMGDELIATISLGEGRPHGEANAKLLATSNRLCKELLGLFHHTDWSMLNDEWHDRVRQTLIDAGCPEDII